MSAIVMGAVMSRGPKKVTPRFVLVAIADNADEYGFAYLSMETIADKACCSMRNASRLVDTLEREGWLKVRRHVFRGRSNVYFVNIEKLGVEVSEKSRKSRMHYEVERMLDVKKPHAKLSDGNAPQAVETDAEPPAKSQGVQRPKTAMPPAKSVIPILKNRCEPSLNQSASPVAPDGGGAVVDVSTKAGVDELVRAECEAALRECGISNPRMLRVMVEAMRMQMARERMAPVEVRLMMVESWRRWKIHAGDMRHSIGPRKFFGEGYWLDEKLWPFDQVRLEQERKRRNRL